MKEQELSDSLAQELSDSLARKIRNEARALLMFLPHRITKNNIKQIVEICKSVSTLTDDAFHQAESLGIRNYFGSWRMMFVPKWKFHWGFETAYAQGFTWESFFDHLHSQGERKITVYPDGFTVSKGDEVCAKIFLESED